MDLNDYNKWWSNQPLDWKIWQIVKYRLSYLCSALFGTVSYAEKTLLQIIKNLMNVNVKDKRINLTSDDIQSLATEYINSAEYEFWLDCAIDDAEINNEMICDVETKYKHKSNLLFKLTGNTDCLTWPKMIKEELLKRKSDARKSK